MASKASKSIFTIGNKTYDILKVVATIILPAIDAFYVALAGIWGLGFGNEIDATIQATIAFINVLLGSFVIKSSSVYRNKESKRNVKPKAKKESSN